MDVILGTDSLNPPLTGVGRYTRELSRELLKSPPVQSLVGYDMGFFHGLEARLRLIDGHDHCNADNRESRLVAHLRSKLSNSSIATSLALRGLSLASQFQLSRYSGAVFHSPNFHLPRAAGPSVVTIHDLTYFHYPHFHPRARIGWMRRAVPPSLALAGHIICVSEATRADLIHTHEVDPGKASVIYPGVSHRFRLRSADETADILRQYGLRHEGYFLMVATIEPRKNLEGLLDAYLSFSKSLRQEIPLVLVGGAGWRCEATLQRIHSVADEGVRWLGYTPEHFLPFLYSGALCFVYPSFYEGFGLSVLEAQASGVPVITSFAASLPEVANMRAILVDPREPADLHAAMLRAVEDNGWRADSIRVGLEHAARFSWQACADQTVAVYRSLLS